MEATDQVIKLFYNTEREKLVMPEYGRNVLSMVEQMKQVRDRAKRTDQARAIVKVMELLNPQVHSQEDYEHKLWDHLYLIAGVDLDVDAPYPAPEPAILESAPLTIPLKTKPVKARHYGRNIESIIDLIATEPEGEVKTAMIRSLAIYMRQQYLIWNKDSVADGRIKVPEGIELSKISGDSNFSRPGMSVNVGGARQGGRNGKFNKKNKNRK